MEDFSQFLFLFAVIIISFLRWVINRLQEGRQQREFQAEVEAEMRSGQSQGQGQAPGSIPPDLPSEHPGQSQQTANEKGLHDLLEAFGLPTTPESEEPDYYEPISLEEEPPPIPEIEPETTPEPVTKLVIPAMAIKDSRLNKRRHQIGHLLRTPGSFQTAFILKEVLDTPKGLKSAEELHYYPSKG